MSKKKSRPLIRWLVRGILAGLLLVVLLFVGSNVFLATSPGRSFIQRNLERRSGLSWQVSGASWSPWNGITVKSLSANLRIPTDEKAPKLPPLLSLKETKLQPYWRQLIQGKKLFREVVLESPQINIPLEYLFIVQPSQPSPPPTVAPSTGPPTAKQGEKPKDVTPKPGAKPPLPPKPASQPKPVGKQPDEKRFWLRMRNANISLYSVKLDKAVTVHGLQLDLPLAGPATSGAISWREIKLADQTLIAPTRLPIEWEQPFWTLPNQDLAVTLPPLAKSNGQADGHAVQLTVRFGGTFAPRLGAPDFRLNASLASQSIPDYLLHGPSQFHLKCPEVAASLTASGRLTHPDGWLVDCNAAARQVEVYSELRGQHFLFDTAYARLGLRQMTLLAPDIALRSERLSLMGNGQLHLGGYLLAVMRIVSDPELAVRFTNVAVGSLITGGWTGSWLRPLETPDRFYRDLHFEGFLPNAAVNVGRKGEFIPLPTIIRYLQSFTAREVAEEVQAQPKEKAYSP